MEKNERTNILKNIKMHFGDKTNGQTFRKKAIQKTKGQTFKKKANAVW